MIRSIADIFAQRKDRGRGAVPGLVPDGLTVLYGETGARKTFTAIGLAARVAGGLPFGDFSTRQGYVLYIAAEDYAGVEDRLAVAVRELDLPDDISIGLMALPMRANDPQFANTVIADVRAALSKAGLKLSLIILDTLSASVDGVSLNDDGAMGAVAGAMVSISREFNCSALIVHHPGKGDRRRERGSQVIRDRPNASIRLEKQGQMSVAIVEKQRNGTIGQRINLGFDLVSHEIAGEMVETLVLSFGDKAADASAASNAHPRSPTGHAAALLACLSTLGPGWHEIETLRTVFYAKLPTLRQDNRKKAFQNARKTLSDGGLIVEGNGKVRENTGNFPDASREHDGEDERETGAGKTPSFKEGFAVLPALPDAEAIERAAPSRERINGKETAYAS